MAGQDYLKMKQMGKTEWKEEISKLGNLFK